MKKILAVLLAILLTGVCVSAEDQALTLDYLLEHTKLTAEDFESIDFETFVKDYGLNIQNYREYSLPDLIKMFREREEYVQYSDIYADPDGKLTETDFKNIRVLLWELHEGNANAYMVIDYGKAAVYYSMSNILDRCGEEDKIADLSQEDILFIEKTLEDSGIVLWKNRYEGINETVSGYFAWSVGCKLADGRCIAYSGNGVVDSGTPAELQMMLKAMQAHFER